MKWIVVAIAAVIVPYTFLTLRYRRPERPFEPYADMKNRANTLRLLSAGFQRIALTAAVPATAAQPAMNATIAAAPGGVPEALRASLVMTPLLPADITGVAAAPFASVGAPYAIQFTCEFPDKKQQLAGADLYVRGEEVIITPDFEKLAGGLLARSRENTILLTVPAGALKPGALRVTLVGERSSRTWSVQVH
jgi:hypothetical protein